MWVEMLALALAGAVKLLSLWFALTGAMFWMRPKPFPRCAPRMRFACLVAARNEARVIGALVSSLLAQRYPADMLDVFVIPNHCTDETESVARRAGAKILRPRGAVHCKGDALRYAFAALRGADYDAFCVLDADNRVHPDFLARMNDAFCAGAGVAKARMCAANPCESWVSGAYAIYYGLNERLYNRSRACLGLSAKLVGTGFAVHRDVLRRLGGWNTRTLAEDAEFSAACARIGERIWWVPEALTYDEPPRSLRVSLTQRRRWCSGIMDAALLEVPALLRAMRGGAVIRKLDMLLFLCLPFAQALSPIPALLSALVGFSRGRADAFAPVCLALAGYAAMVCLAALICRDCGLRLRAMGKSIALFPVFMATWLPLQIVSLVKRTKEWKEIRHFGGRDQTEKTRRRIPNGAVRQ